MHKLIPIFFLSILISVHSQDTNKKGLSDDYKDHFMIGTIYHGAVLGNDNQNPNQKKEFEITNREFNAITAENCMKPMYLIDENGAYDFEESDAFVAYAQSNGLTIIGHTLVWKNSAPDWFFKGDDGKVVSRDVLIQRLEAYIETVVTRYKGKIAYWDVVNEAVDIFRTKDGQKYAKLKPTPWHDIIGDDYIKIAYEAAHRADPDCKLLYNDFNMYQKEKIDFIIAMVKNLRAQGVPIHGIGSQGHMFMQHPLLEEVEYWLNCLLYTSPSPRH